MRFLRLVVWVQGVALLAVIAYLLYPRDDPISDRIADYAFDTYAVNVLDCRSVDPGGDASGLMTYHCLLPHRAASLEAAPRTEAGSPDPPRGYPRGVCFYFSPRGVELIQFATLTQPLATGSYPCGQPSGP